jgi:hypothetical protein
VQSELEYKKRADDEALRKKNIIYQLNADQEQRERIQEFRAIEFHLKDVLGVTTTESQNIEREKREDVPLPFALAIVLSFPLLLHFHQVFHLFFPWMLYQLQLVLLIF